MQRLFLLLVSLATTAFAQINLNHRISELKLRDGRVLEDVQLTGYAASSAIAKWNGGRGTIPYELFPAEYEVALQKIRPPAKKGSASTVVVQVAQKSTSRRDMDDRSPRQSTGPVSSSTRITSDLSSEGDASVAPIPLNEETTSQAPLSPVGGSEKGEEAGPDQNAVAAGSEQTENAKEQMRDPRPAATMTTAPAREHVSGDAAWAATRFWIVGSVVVGTGLSSTFLWLFSRRKPTTRMSAFAMQKVWDAGTGLPSHAEVRGWSVGRQCAVIAGFAESDGYCVEPNGTDQLLLRSGLTRTPGILVQCLSSARGKVDVETFTEFSTLLRHRGIPRGWLVAPGGFSARARAAAVAHPNILPVDDEAALELLRAVPPGLLGKVLNHSNDFAASCS